jgi:uncharacterized membrane protein YjgN (DUF898 family)
VNEIIVSPPVAASSRISFVSNRPAFRRMVMRGAMLELMTIGFYRFWLATDIRRHLWTHTSVDGDAAEYTGAGKELLIGFLFAVAILAPVYLVYFLIGLEAERLQAFASFPLGLFFYFFIQFAIYRARRYRLTRTVWRGVRFSMKGSGWNYAWRAALWSLLAIVTLGLALPWRQAALERFKMRHTAYGDLKGRFDGTGWELFKRGWWLWLLVLLAAVVPGIITAVAAVAPSKGSGASGGVLFATLMFMSVFVGSPFIYGAYKAIEWRWWLSGLRLGEVTFSSGLGSSALFGLYWKVVGWGLLIMVALTVVIGGLLAAVAATSSGATTGEKFAVASQQLPVLIGMGATYIVMALALGVVLRIYLMHDVWKRVADSATVSNLSAADNVTAQGQLVGALGEGFADSLDVVGF